MSIAIDTLNKSSYFSDLDKSQLERVAALAENKRFPRGDVLLKESDKGETVFLVVKGRVDVSVSLIAQNKREVIATLGEGELVGEMVLLGKTRRTADVVAKDDVDVISFKHQDLAKLFDSDPRIAFIVMRNIARQMAERLIATNQVLRNALTMSISPVY